MTHGRQGKRGQTWVKSVKSKKKLKVLKNWADRADWADKDRKQTLKKVSKNETMTHYLVTGCNPRDASTLKNEVIW